MENNALQASVRSVIPNGCTCGLLNQQPIQECQEIKWNDFLLIKGQRTPFAVTATVGGVDVVILPTLPDYPTCPQTDVFALVQSALLFYRRTQFY